MAVDATMTEKVVDKATGLFKKGFATFDKMVFLEEGQQDTVNTTATNFKLMQSIMETNIEEIEASISNMDDAEEIRKARKALELLKDQGMKDTAQSIAAGEEVGISQMKQFGQNLMDIKKGLGNINAQVEISFDGLVKEYSNQIVSEANSDKAQDAHFRSLLIAMRQQSSYLEQQIEQMDKQEDLNEEQIALLAANKKDLVNINQYSEKMTVFSKMGPEELKKNKDSLVDIVGELKNDRVFESKMYTTMNQIDNSIQSLSTDSEILNETMNDLTEAQMSGKEVIAGTAKQLKQGAKGMVSSMVLSAMGLGGLDEALGLSEKFSQLDLFGRKGLFGKGGLLSNIMQLKGMSGAVGGGLAVAGAGAAGYAFGSWLNKKVDEMGGEKGFLGSTLYKWIHGEKENREEEVDNVVAEAEIASRELATIDVGLDNLNTEIARIKKKADIEYFLPEKEKELLAEVRQKKERLLKRREEMLVETGAIKGEEGRAESILETYIGDISPFDLGMPDVGVAPFEDKMDFDLGKEKTMTEKASIVNTNVLGDQIINQGAVSEVMGDQVIDQGAITEVMNPIIEPVIKSVGVMPEEVTYLPKIMEDTTQMIIDNSKKEKEKVVESSKQAPIVVIPPTPPTPVDLSKSVDDVSLTILNNDIFG